MQKLKAGASHPARQQLLRMAELYAESEALWGELTDEERAIAYAAEDDDASPDLPAVVKTYFGLQASCHAIHRELQAVELAKVEGALAELRDWLTSPPPRDVV
jgi:hypothetical protein